MITGNQKQVLKKITTILKENGIPFQLTGGLAAIAYGSQRPLYDIDIDVYKKDMPQVKDLFSEYITKDLFNLKDKHWDIWVMMLEVDGVIVDITQVENWYYKDPNGNKKLMTGKPEDAEIKEVADMQLPVLKKEVLLDYKQTIARATDLEDVGQIS